MGSNRGVRLSHLAPRRMAGGTRRQLRARVSVPLSLLPFTKLSGRLIEQDYFVDGVTETSHRFVRASSGSSLNWPTHRITYKGKSVTSKDGRELHMPATCRRFRANVAVIRLRSKCAVGRCRKNRQSSLGAERFDKTNPPTASLCRTEKSYQTL